MSDDLLVGFRWETDRIPARFFVLESRIVLLNEE